MTLRAATPADLPAIRAIYEYWVLHGTGSFEITPPDLAEMTARWRVIRDAGLPYLVAELDGIIAAFGYAAPYRPRPAYRHTVENSVYVAPEAQGRGLGRALLQAVIDAASAAGKRQMIAVIGDSANTGSIALHRALGFREVGTFESVGFKSGQWRDTVLMQRALGDGATSAPPDPDQPAPGNRPSV
jgi:phosphinothricin acetyltransferase